jgi:UDP-N-acetylmuramyl tripeptide synthase
VKPRLTDSRRLTGANLFWEHPSAIIDVAFDGSLDPIIRTWRSQAQSLLEAVGYGEQETCYRTFDGGGSLVISAPIDVLYSMCELNEVAWAGALGDHGLDELPDIDTEVARLRRLFAEEATPQLLALQQAAHEHAVPFLWDDDEVSAGYGESTQIWPRDSLPDPDQVQWAGLGDIPLALVTGTNGKSTTVRMIASILTAAGLRAGLTSTDFIRVGDRIIDRGDYSGTGGARMLMRHPDVEASALEVARGGLLRRGLGVEHANVAVVTNVAADHLGDYGINTVDELIPAKFIVRRALGPNDPLVLNADDTGVVAYAESLHNRLVWFTLDRDNPHLQHSRLEGELGAYFDDGWLVIQEGGQIRRLVHANEVPSTHQGAARYNIANALAALLAAVALGIEDQAIRSGLAAFRGDESDNPGRGNWFQRELTTDEGTGTVRVLVDFAHNEHGMLALAEAVRNIPADRVMLLMGQAGDRLDKDIADYVRAACTMQPDRLLIAELPGYERGRAPFEVPKIIHRVALESGLLPAAIEEFTSPEEATADTLNHARPGDLIVLLALTQRNEALDLVHRFIANGD